MAVDKDLLRIAKHRKQYKKISGGIAKELIDPKTAVILKDFGKYFEKFPSKDTIDAASFLPRFRQWHPELNDESYLIYAKILRNIKEDVTDDVKDGIIAELAELSLGTNLANIVQQYNDGELEFPLGDIISQKLDFYKKNRGKGGLNWDNADIDELLKQDANEEGLRWRLQPLNDSMRPLRPGDSGIIAGRPDKGKTTFVTSEVTYMAAQLPPDKNILWFCNEGSTGSIWKRVYQSALGCGVRKLVRLSEKGLLKDRYAEAIGGRIDKIRIVQAHGFHVGQVEALIEENNPGVVVFDMIDNIKGFDNEARTDRQLEAMYQWARELAVKYNFVSLATSQISNEGDNERWPSLGMLKDSKTGKQGACDFQLMIGALNDAMYDNVRFISLPKNKLRREGAKGNPRAEVAYLPEIARYAEIQEVEEEATE